MKTSGLVGACLGSEIFSGPSGTAVPPGLRGEHLVSFRQFRTVEEILGGFLKEFQLFKLQQNTSFPGNATITAALSEF